MSINKALQAYFAELTAALPSGLTPEAFKNNQLLPLLTGQNNLKLARNITYYIQELDALETIPVNMLTFKCQERIDAEHLFMFYEGSAGNWYNPLVAAGQVLRATVALVPIAGLMRLLVQQVDAISEACFTRDHQHHTEYMFAIAS